jgi:hypothetical protein
MTELRRIQRYETSLATASIVLGRRQMVILFGAMRHWWQLFVGSHRHVVSQEERSGHLFSTRAEAIYKILDIFFLVRYDKIVLATPPPFSLAESLACTNHKRHINQ